MRGVTELGASVIDQPAQLLRLFSSSCLTYLPRNMTEAVSC